MDMDMDIPKNKTGLCKNCSVYDAQDSKEICVKCEKFGFIVGDKTHNTQVRRRVVSELKKDLSYLWYEMTHTQRALTVYHQNTHPDIIWGMQESGFSVAHAIAYGHWSWCEERGFSYIVANTEQSGISKCSRCIRLLEENGIEDY